MGQSISLQLNRSLSIAPALQRSLQLLQMNALEFEQEISQALDSNPLLEMEEGAEKGDAPEALATDGATAEGGDPLDSLLDSDSAPEGAEFAEPSTADSFDDLSRDDLSAYDDVDPGMQADSDSAAMNDSDLMESIATEHSEAAGDEFNEHLSDWSTTSKSTSGEGLTALDMAHAHGSLREHLLQQLGSTRISPVDQYLCSLIIDSLDPAGYLREDLDELAEIAQRLLEDHDVRQGGNRHCRTADRPVPRAEFRSSRCRSPDDRRVPDPSVAGSARRCPWKGKWPWQSSSRICSCSLTTTFAGSPRRPTRPKRSCRPPPASFARWTRSPA